MHLQCEFVRFKEGNQHVSVTIFREYDESDNRQDYNHSRLLDLSRTRSAASSVTRDGNARDPSLFCHGQHAEQ